MITQTTQSLNAVPDTAQEKDGEKSIHTQVLSQSSTASNSTLGGEAIRGFAPEIFHAPRIEPPSVAKILKFAIPAIGVWLCGPLLSLIDTGAVGLLSGTTQQAALGPATAVANFALLCVAFMNTGATNLVASAQESERNMKEKPKTTSSFITSLQLSTYVGLGLGSVLFVFARQILRALIGNDTINPEILTTAMTYVRIRALGMPAAVVISSAQAACLGMQDVLSPLYALVAAAVVNFVGDVVCVGCPHPLIGGAAGAAWATVLSQYAAVAFFMKWLCGKPKTTVTKSEGRLEGVGRTAMREVSRRVNLGKIGSKSKKMLAMALTKLRSVKPTKTQKKPVKELTLSTRGFLEGKFKTADLVKLPKAEKAKEFAPFVYPVTSSQVGRVSAFVTMNHVVSSSMGTMSMAAQQIIMSLFDALCPVADSLSLTAQSLVPAIAEKETSVGRSRSLRKTMRNFFKAGGIFGAAVVGAVACIPLMSRYFTSDPLVISLVNKVVPSMAGIFALHGILLATEGVLLGQKDLGFLGKMYASFFIAVPAMMLRVKKAALGGSRAVDVTSVWNVFLGYQAFRFSAWVFRACQLQRQSEKKALEGEMLLPLVK
mmetsp:Transcript_6918/g.15836  ORF Transcript_6918/g.15836 Transcript_6918/m.15836 type:complete len:600 (-) Transcript_6918:68-1867(-)